MILVYVDMFLKLKDISDSPSFKESDINHDGTIFPKDFKDKLESSKKYSGLVKSFTFKYLLNKYPPPLPIIVHQLLNHIVLLSLDTKFSKSISANS